MKLSIFAPLALLSSLAAAINVSFDTVYDNSTQSLAIVACSTGSNGLLTRGFTTFGSLPSFPRIGGAPAVTGFNSAACGTCWNLTFTNAQKVSTSIFVTAIDVATPDFNIALAAMNQLTGGQAEEIGRAPITASEVAASNCGL
ncbi:Cerato-platanin [Pholiota molesta]|nr:Cerato-platanin [Pholiota molesta]